ncbi:hypothetical protein GOP47_0024172 [Adiantum capillus-veneris]|uniref:Radical S-adenosyl methionine domain-containing protein 1, mitochondrial n=1 Tax=Adiantum capillus-veneris TaxID=13818 RepID=A0A9D4U5C0_ADICA|nr:hypothetical protein GOP47_0024172 [Adiantum capillus-veneris]
MKTAISVVAMASASASSKCAAFCKQTRRSHFNSTLRAQLCTQRSSFSDVNRQHNQHRPGLLFASSRDSKLHERIVYVHSSAHSELGLEDKKPPLGLFRDDAHVRRNELPSSGYVHLPFCKRRCFYCDFAIVAVGERNTTSAAHIDSTMDSYVNSLCAEVVATLEKLPQPSPLKTLFFGGGTPSLLPAHHLSRIIEIFDRICGFHSNAEVSIEMDPGTFDRVKMKEFLNCGVNRISLGVQAFNDDFLKACGRSHGLQDVYEAIDIIHDLGVRNWSLDLISSLPHQTVELWEESLRKTIELAPAHVSVYDLQIEEGTKFGTWYKPGQHPLPNEDNSAAFYRLASSLLKEAGYEHYEISNYAKPGFQCRHNLVYWKNQSYYGFGLGATSYVNGKRLSRPRKWKEYADFVDLCIQQKQQKSAELCANEDAMENVVDTLCDTIMLSLRLACGLDLHYISRTFGYDWCSCICKGLMPFIKSGHAVVLDSNLKSMSSDVLSEAISRGSASLLEKDIMFIRLADPEGFLLSNEIISSLFSALPSG